MNCKLFSLIGLLSLIACQSNEYEKEDFNIKIELDTSNVVLDSITLKSAKTDTKITAKHKGNSTLFKLKDSVNDLYDFKLYTNQGVINKKIWLKGEAIVIKASLKPSTLTLDTVINSPLFYEVQENSKILKSLYLENDQNPKIDSFLLKKISEHLNSPISFVMADTYMYRNRENLTRLIRLRDLFNQQSSNFKNHPLQINQKLDEAINQLENN